MKKFIYFTLFVLTFSRLGYTQPSVLIENRHPGFSLLFSAGKNQEEILSSENYFFDAEYHVPAFGFFISHDPGKLVLKNYSEGWFQVTDRPETATDQVQDGNKQESISDNFNSQSGTRLLNFPVWSVKKIEFRGNIYFHLVIRPWIAEKNKLKLLSQIQFDIPASSSGNLSVLSPLTIFQSSAKHVSSLGKTHKITVFDKSEGTVFRILLSKTGVAKLFYQDLVSLGEPVSLANIDSRRIKLYNDGEEIPVLISDGGDGVFSEGDYLEFFCEERKINLKNPMKDIYFDPFTKYNVYFLVLNAKEISGNRLGVISGELKEPIALGDPRNLLGESFPAKLHFEKNTVFERLAKKDTTKTVDFRDHWFWNQIALNEQTSYLTPTPFSDGLSFKDVKITIALHGITYTKPSGFSFEHNLKVDIGTREKALSLGFPEKGFEKWNGQELNIAEFTVPPSSFVAYMSDKNASIFIQNYDPFSPNVAPSRKFALNWIEIDYHRLYTANENYLEFRLPEDKKADLYQFMIQDFSQSEIEIYKKGVGKVSNFSIESYPRSEEESGRYYRAIFQDYVVNPVSAEYIALTENAKIRPDAIQFVNPSVLATPDLPLLRTVDRDESMIIIAADRFWSKQISQSSFSPVKQYSEYREKTLAARALNDNSLSGRSKQVLTTSISDVYDEFSNGVKSPYAIKDFIRFAVQNWKRTPLYVLLIGDAASDFYSTEDLIPSMQVQTVEFGSATADPWYAMVDGEDIIPDIALGRIPAKTTDEIFAYLNKLKEYENDKNFDGWRNNSLFISGFEESFISDNDTLRNLASKNFFTDVLHIKELGPGVDPFFGGKSQLINYLNKGQIVVNFMGHGGGGIWADRGLFDIPDVDRLANTSKLSFVSSLTCYTGDFTESGRTSLMEKLILTGSKGAIAGIGSTGVGWKKNNRYLGESTFRYLLNPKYRNLSAGQLIDLSKFFYRIRYSDYITYPFQIPNSQIHQYNFLGDPSVHLQFPENDVSSAVPAQLLATSDSVKLNFQTDKIQNGTVLVKFADKLNQDLFAKNPESFSFSNGRFNASIPVPEELKGQEGYLKYYLSGSESDGAGSIKFTFSDILLNSVFASDSLQQENRPLSLKVSIQSKVSVSEGKLLLSVVDQVDDTGTLGKVEESNSKPVTSGVLFTKEYDLVNSGQNLWVMSDTIPRVFVKNGYQFRYQIQFKDISQKEYIFSGFYELNELPDISAAPQIAGIGSEYYTNKTLGFYYKDGPKIGAMVYNPSNIDVDKVIVRFFGGGVVNSDPPFFSGKVLNLGETTTSLSRNSGKMVFIPIPPEAIMTPGSVYQLSVQAMADSANGQREKSYSNNLSKPFTTPFNLYEVGNGKNDIIKYSGITLDFSKLSSESLALFVKTNESSQINNQPGLSPVSVPEFGNHAVELVSFNPSVKVDFPSDVQMSLKYGAETGSLTAVSLFEFDVKSNKWLRVPTSADTVSKSLVSTIKRFGTYRLFRFADAEPPKVLVSVNGNDLGENGIVPLNGNFTLVVQDDNGVSRKVETVSVTLDGEKLNTAELSIPDTLSDGNQMVLNFRKTFSPGKHFLSYSFQDASGNSVRVEDLEFTASNKSDFIFYGGFPNPFQGYQIFTFTLNNEATRVQLKIYTVSGKLINKFDSKNSVNPVSFFPDQNYTGLGIITIQSSKSIIGYREIFWNGTDSDAYPVANGVYFIKAIVTFEDGKTVEKVFKSVRIN